MRTAAYKVGVASDRRRRKNVNKFNEKTERCEYL